MTMTPVVYGVDALCLAMYPTKDAGRTCVVAFKPTAYSS